MHDFLLCCAVNEWVYNPIKKGDRMKASKFAQITFLVVGALTALEFIFVRGTFSWIIAVLAIVVAGAANIILNIKHKNGLQAALYALSSVAFCMGYFVLA